MKISVITVCRNAAATLSHCIDSVASQDYPCREHLIIDGASTDGTAEIVEEYRDRISYFISEPDNGIYHAMNKGMSMAGGDVIGFLNADDFFACDTVLSYLADALQSPQVQAVYGDLNYVDAKNSGRVVRCWKAGPYRKGNFLKGWVPPHPTFYCRKDVYEKLGGFREQFTIAADFELMLRFMEIHAVKTVYLPQVMVHMRTGGKANRLNGIGRGNREILRSFSTNNLRVSPLYFIYKPFIKIRQLLRTGGE